MKRPQLLLSLLVASCALSPGPAREAQQLALRDSGDVAAMRRHAWSLFAAVTQGGPAFNHWATLPQTFDGAATAGRPFRLVEEPGSPGVPLRQASGAPLLSLVLLNPPAYRHIRALRLFRRATLVAINAGFGAAPPAARQIAPFPRDAMAMKLIWAVVHADRPTPVSVWDGPGDAVAGNPPAHWPRTVLVDAGALDLFYHIPIGAADVASVRAIDPSARLGDHLVLLAMHLTSKEIPDWIWATYWWHDRPDAGPFAAQRSAAVSGPWRNYLMDMAYSMETPAESDGTANVAFNPYIEVFPAGTRSNCMSCHQGAVWTPNGAPPFLPVTRGARQPGDPLFRTGTRLDFMWSLATEAR